MFRLHPCDSDEESITMIEDQPLNTTDQGQLLDDTSLESGVMELGSNESIATEKKKPKPTFWTSGFDGSTQKLRKRDRYI